MDTTCAQWILSRNNQAGCLSLKNAHPCTTYTTRTSVSLHHARVESRESVVSDTIHQESKNASLQQYEYTAVAGNSWHMMRNLIRATRKLRLCDQTLIGGEAYCETALLLRAFTRNCGLRKNADVFAKHVVFLGGGMPLPHPPPAGGKI